MGSGGEAQRAIQALNGTDLDRRILVVNEAKPMERRDGVEEVEETGAAGVTAGSILVLE